MKTCVGCGAQVPYESIVCPKCKGTSFTYGDDSPLRKVHSFFSTPVPFYVKATNPIIEDEDLIKFHVEWKLYSVRFEQNAPSVLVWDPEGFIKGVGEIALSRISDGDLSEVIAALPKKKLFQIQKILEDEWGVLFFLDSDDDSKEGKKRTVDPEDLLEKLKESNIVLCPVPRLRDVSILKKVDWRRYVEGLASPKKGKDPTLKTAHEAKILKPISMNIAPHSIELLNSNTGKSSFYIAAGNCIDKVTTKAVLGFAKSPNEVFPGTINGTEVPTAFDQIGMQDSWGLAKYMFNILETGEAWVDAGGIRFKVQTGSCFAYLGNPQSREAKMLAGFRALLNHITINPAIGRRFGIFLYAIDFKTIEGTDKMSLIERKDWKDKFTLFRAVEEYVTPNLKILASDPFVVNWLHTPVPGYRNTVYSTTQNLNDYNLATFFQNLAEGEHRVRGAALHAAIAMLLDRIALGTITTEEIIAEAEEYVNDYAQMNLQSVITLCEQWGKQRVELATSYYYNLSEYVQEIVSAILHYHKANPEEIQVPLHLIPYEPENKKAYSHFSKCVNLLKRRKRLPSNNNLRDYFGFQLVKEDSNFIAEYFKTPEPPRDLKLKGGLSSISSVSSFREGFRQTEISTEIKITASEQEKISLSEVPTKPRNSRKPRKPEEEEIGLVAESCEFWHTPKCSAGVPSAVNKDNPCPQRCANYTPKEDPLWPSSKNGLEHMQAEKSLIQLKAASS